jgi:uncharacterized protein (TIGR02246 family)
MIASIFEVMNRSRSGEGDTPLAIEEGRGLTRAHFLRVAAMGAVTAGVGLTAGRALAATSSKRIAPVTDIDKLYDVWQARCNAFDIEGMVDLYVAGVTYVNPQGKVYIDRDGVRADFVEMFKVKPVIELHDRKHLLYKDIALTTNHWTMQITTSDGVKQTMKGGGIEVLQKQADGGWRFIIDDASRSAS